MFISNIGVVDLSTKRLDSDFYRPDYIENDRLLSDHKVTTLSSCGKFFAGPFGSKLPSNLYLSKGVPLFRVGNVGLFEVDEGGFAYLDPIVHSELNSSEVVSGDLLIVKASVGEKICRVPESLPKANITQHIIAIRPNGKFDIDFVSVFLVCNYGRKQLERFSLGSIIQYLGINDARDVKLLDIGVNAQKYIGDKVRQAECLRDLAKTIETEVSEFHEQFVPDQSQLNYGRKTRRVDTSRMTDRFDAHFYPGVVDDYLSQSGINFHSLSSLCVDIFNGQTQGEQGGGVFVDQITVTNLSRSFVKGTPRRVIKPANDTKYTKSFDLLMCNAAHNKSYIGREFSYCHSERELLPSTEVMVIRVSTEKVPASFIRYYLLTKLGFVQVQSTIRGITAHSYPTDMAKLDIPLPNVPDSMREEWFECDQRMALAGHACELATLLTAGAKSIVEALIEDRLTEQQIILAQQSLDGGDDSLDREILSSLSSNKLGAVSAPLFTDLNQLYGLLAQCQQAED
ncbi:MAG: restriction endonuclease subunit S [Gammaproteobacteria bacterium]|nr:MAG: restriction endonuclease subunit S [Gammaproteobacteria bacterium]